MTPSQPIAGLLELRQTGSPIQREKIITGYFSYLQWKNKLNIGQEGLIFFKKSTPGFPRDRPLVAIGYNYNYLKVLGFIATEYGGSNIPGDPYLSCLPDNRSIFSI